MLFRRTDGGTLAITTPNEIVPHRVLWLLAAAWFGTWTVAWAAFRPAVFPSPVEVIQSFPGLWFDDGLAQALIASFIVNWQALVLATGISLGLAYLSRVPFFVPLVVFVSKLRFVSLAAFLFVFEFMAANGDDLKVDLLTFGITVFFVTSMAGVISNIRNEQYDHARTLRMTEWQTIWYVTIRGTMDLAIDAIRDNAAMGWSMVVMVEGLVRSGGGVGVLMLNNAKHFNLAEVWAIASCIFLVGLGQDFFLGQVKRWLCPWAE